MAITATQSNPLNTMRFSSGSHLDSATTPEALVVSLGYTPRYVQVYNETDGLVVEYLEALAATKTKKTGADGAITLAVDSAIVVSQKGFTFLKSLTVQNKQYRWFAIG